MPGAFGYVKYPQQKAPDPREIGLALLKMGQQSGPDPDMDPGMEPDMDADDQRRRLIGHGY